MMFRGVVAVPVVVVGVWLGVAGGGLAGESGFGVKVGDTEEAVLNALGKPKGSMAMSGRKTLSYAECYVVVENGVVVQIDGRSPPRSEPEAKTDTPATSSAATSAVLIPEKDVQFLMKKIKSSKGTEQANAVMGCNGEWAAEAIPLLIPLLENTTPFEVVTLIGHAQISGGGTTMGQLAGGALGQIGSASWDPCMGVLQSGSAYARANAAEALGMIWKKGRPDDATFPTALLATFESSIMAASPQALVHKGRMAEVVEKVNTPEALRALHACLPNPDVNFTVDILRCLGKRGDVQSIPLLADACLTHSNDYVRRTAGEALQLYTDPAAGRAVLSGVKHSNMEVRLVVAELLGKAKDPAFGPALIGLLKDENERVRRMAVRSLGRVGGESVLLPLAGVVLSDPSEAVARDAFNLLCGPVLNNQDPALVKALLPGLYSPDANRRAWSAELLGRTKSPEVFDALARAARRDSSAEVRKKVLCFIDGFENPERSEVVLECLMEDPETAVRQAAMQTVKYGSLREKQSEILLQLVRGKNEERALEAAFVMDELHLVNRHPEVLSVFLEALKSSENQMRTRAGEALCREAGIPRFSAKGKELGDDPDAWEAWWKAQGVAVR